MTTPLPADPPLCPAAALAVILPQLQRDAGRLLLLLDAGEEGRGLGEAAPADWAYLAAPPAAGISGPPLQPCRHFAAVAIPAGYHPMGVLSLAAPGRGARVGVLGHGS